MGSILIDRSGDVECEWVRFAPAAIPRTDDSGWWRKRAVRPGRSAGATVEYLEKERVAKELQFGRAAARGNACHVPRKEIDARTGAGDDVDIVGPLHIRVFEQVQFIVRERAGASRRRAEVDGIDIGGFISPASGECDFGSGKYVDGKHVAVDRIGAARGLRPHEVGPT